MKRGLEGATLKSIGREMGVAPSLLMHYFESKEVLIQSRSISCPALALGKPPLAAGETKDVQVDLDTMVREYQKLLSADSKTGLPPAQVLQELGLPPK